MRGSRDPDRGLGAARREGRGGGAHRHRHRIRIACTGGSVLARVARGLTGQCGPVGCPSASAMPMCRCQRHPSPSTVGWARALGGQPAEPVARGRHGSRNEGRRAFLDAANHLCSLPLARGGSL